MRVLVVAYEAAPFFKRGGLGDVMESLPKALRHIGVDASICIPYYKQVQKKHPGRHITDIVIPFVGKEHRIGIYESFYGRDHVPAYFLHNSKYLDSDEAPGKNERIAIFIFFSFAVSHFVKWLATQSDRKIDLVHCNDWHSALIPYIFKEKLHMRIPAVLSIHNLAYQGQCDPALLDKFDLLDYEAKELIQTGRARSMNLLGEGILRADKVATVSPAYAKEIMAVDKKNLVEPFLAQRKIDYNDKVIGILNGIDDHVWSPHKNTLLAKHYNVMTFEEGKKFNKEVLLKALGLSDLPTFCFIGRMAHQKGIDILEKQIDPIMKNQINIVILGEGYYKIVHLAEKMARKYKNRVRYIGEFDEPFAHRLYAGSDFILIPSHYEPCGLIQMIAMRYGTLPIAADTGGLHDSINNGKDGFLFKNRHSRALVKVIKRALNVYNHDRARMLRMIHTAMKKDFSWHKSAREYKRVYAEILSS